MEHRPYTPADAEALWELKVAFERSLGDANEEKAASYDAKLTDAYRDRYLAWANDCVERDPGCITLATDDAVEGTVDGAVEGTVDGAVEGAVDGAVDEGVGGTDQAAVVGYVFVLPESLSFIWDAGVVNELYVAPKYRGSGVADDLMDAAVAHAREQEIPMDRLVLDVDPDNERAYAFYENCGFEPWGELVAREL